MIRSSDRRKHYAPSHFRYSNPPTDSSVGLNDFPKRMLDGALDPLVANDGAIRSGSDRCEVTSDFQQGSTQNNYDPGPEFLAPGTPSSTTNVARVLQAASRLCTDSMPRRSALRRFGVTSTRT